MLPALTDETLTPAGLRWRFAVPAESFFFEGHFPGHPILPGVVALGWMLAAAERFLGRPLPAAALHNVKFQVVLLPGTAVELTVTPQRRLLLLLQARLASAEGTHASVLIEPEAE